MPAFWLQLSDGGRSVLLFSLAIMKSPKRKECPALSVVVAALACTAASCSQARNQTATSPLVSNQRLAPVVGPGTSAIAAPASPTAPEPLESPVSRVRFEGRTGERLEQLCAAWRAELLAAVKSEHEAGFGYDNYDAQGIVCAKQQAVPNLEGTLPYGWTILSTVNLQYFDGAAMLDDRYLLLERADGTLVVGPKYGTSNDIGDTAPPAACRLALVPWGNVPVLVVVSLEIGDRPDPMGEDGKPGPNAQYSVRHSGRTCRFEPTRFSCEPADFTVFKERNVSSAERNAMLLAPKPEVPELDARTGRILEP